MVRILLIMLGLISFNAHSETTIKPKLNKSNIYEATINVEQFGVLDKINKLPINFYESCKKDQKCNTLQHKFSGKQIKYGLYDHLFIQGLEKNCNLRVYFESEHTTRINSINNISEDIIDTHYFSANRDIKLINTQGIPLLEDTLWNRIQALFSFKPKILYKRVEKDLIVYKYLNLNKEIENIYFNSDVKLEELNIEFELDQKKLPIQSGKSADGINFKFDLKIPKKTLGDVGRLRVEKIYAFVRGKDHAVPEIYSVSQGIGSNNYTNTYEISLPENMMRRNEYLTGLKFYSPDCNLEKLEVSLQKRYYRFFPKMLSSFNFNPPANLLSEKKFNAFIPIFIYKNGIKHLENKKYIKPISDCGKGKFCESFELMVSGNSYIHSQKPIKGNFSSQCLKENYTDFNDAIIESSSTCNVRIKKDNEIVIYLLIDYSFDEILEANYYDYIEAGKNLYTRSKIFIESNNVPPNSFLSIQNESSSKFDIIFQFESCQLREAYSENKGVVNLAVKGPCGKIIGLEIIPKSGVLKINSNIQFFYSTSIKNKIMSSPFYEKETEGVDRISAPYFLTDNSYGRLVDGLKNSQKAFGYAARINTFKAELFKLN